MSPITQNYYKLLGLKKGASSKEIKRSYRKLAKKYHPDQAKNMSLDKAEEQFKKINEAYSILSDPDKRAHYDRFGKRGLDYSGPRNGGVYYSNFSQTKSRRQIIDDKIKTGINFSISQFADELGVKSSNLETILQTMIDKDMVQGKIERDKFVFIE